MKFYSQNKKRLFPFLELLILICVLSCLQKPTQNMGILHIKSLTPGTYEIYSVAGDSSLQFVSEHMGYFNQDLVIAPGDYLVLADCSHRKIKIQPGERYEALAHAVEFIPPHEPQEGDLFSIQCGRYESSHLKQQINNRYLFHMISGTKDLLVGMLPLKIDFPSSTIPQKISFELSALKISNQKHGMKDLNSLYFVSPSSDLLSITQPQTFGKWQFLLPESYHVYINGTEQLIELKPKESHTIYPAGLTIQTYPETNLDLFTKIRGNPFSIELNDHHSLEINTYYPVLPGFAKLRFDGAKSQHLIELKEHQTTILKMKNVHIDLGCSPLEWECLGKREVNLYLPNQQYSFLDSISDVPILYLEQQIQVGIEGSKGIRYKIPKNKNNVRLSVGKVKILPKSSVKPGYITDLLRLEAYESTFDGHSMDISPDKETVMTLISGTYYLTRYSSFGPDMERKIQKQIVKVVPGELTTIEIPFYISENKYSQRENDPATTEGRYNYSGLDSDITPLEAW